MNLYQPTITGSLSVSGSVNISGSITIAGGGTISGTASIATTALTASFVANAQTASYVLNAVSSSFALTASSADNLLVRNTLTAQTLVVQTITSSVVYSSGSNIFGNITGNTQTFTGSILTSGNIGLGITPSAWNGIYRVFQIDAGSISSSPSYNNISVSANVFYNAGNSPRYIVSDYATLYGQDDGLHAWYTAPSGIAGAAMTFTQSMTLTAAGNLGVGTTSPASQAAGATTGILDVSAATGGNLVLHRTSGGDTALFSILKASNGTYIDSVGAATAANNAIYFRTNNNNADQTSLTSSLTITSGGNVGIATSSPESFGAFAVRKSVSLNSKNVSVSFSDATNSTFDVRHPAANIVDLSSQNSALTFSTSNSSSDGIERMRIGTTGDADIRIGGNYSNHAAANRGTININGTNTAMISLSTGANTNKGYIYHGGNYMEVWNVDNSYLAFGTNNGERMRITPAGDICAIRNVSGIVGSYRNLSFGAATLMARDAYDSYFCGNLYYDSGGWKLKYASQYGNCVNWYSGEYSFQRSTTAGAADSTTSLQSNFYLDVNGNATFRGTVTPSGTPSDINLKENLVKITSPLEKISQINGYNFDWKTGTPSNGLVIPVAEGMQAPESPLSIVHDAGLIAQEVEAVMPQLVRDNGHKALNYNGIIALLVEGIKELKAEFDAYKTTHP